MEIILNGVISGIVLAFLIGPVFFTILQTSIERGFSSGAFVAVGVSLSDAFYITVTYLGVYQLFDQGGFREYLAYFGGIVLLMFGAYYLFIKSRKLSRASAQEVRADNPWKLVGKGFIINGLSPMVLIFWLGTVGIATTKFGYSTPQKAVPFFASIVGTVLVTDLLKAKLADKLRRLLTPPFIKRLNLVLGFVLVVFGIRLIYYAAEFAMQMP
ncbi:MAG TPA: LysE family transporter [Chryseosolibacter sp.]|nr:LysE family transporter [Chryseosolibacter sp.]